MFISEKVEELEERYGDLQSQYNAWRRETEQANVEKPQGKIFTNCEFVEARESFSEYCGMEETIPFDVMLWCENGYLEE